MSVSTASRARRSRKQNPLGMIFVIVILLAIPLICFQIYHLSQKPSVRPVVAVKPKKEKEFPPPSAFKHGGAPRAKRLYPDFDTENTDLADSGGANYRGGIRDNSGSGSSGAVGGSPLTRIGDELRKSIKLQPTLVVWLFDRSASAADLRQQVSRELTSMYQSLSDVRKSDAAGNSDSNPLLSAVGTFADDVQWLVEQPSANDQELSSSIDKISNDPGYTEKTFMAVNIAVEKFLPYQTMKNRRLVMVLVTDEVGDDEDQLDTVLPTLTKYTIPVCVVGVNAPLGRVVGTNPSAEGEGPGNLGQPRVRQGPETLFPEFIKLDYPSGGYSQSDTEVIDSGYGPAMLTRLANETGGKFLSMGGIGGAMSAGRQWSGAGGETTSKGANPRAYLPDYISKAQYLKFLDSNKAAKALHEAAKLPRAEIASANGGSYAPGENPALLARQLDGEMRPFARVRPGIEKLVEVLKSGEADSAKLTKLRWKAGYDLAYGRALAADTRAGSFIDILASLKTKALPQGKSSFEVGPSDEVTVNSVRAKNAKKAKDLLEGVVKNHPGTVWATMAERELKAPMGFKLSER